MAGTTAPGDPLRIAQALEGLTEALVKSLEGDAGDPEAILERRRALLEAAADTRAAHGEAKRRLEAIRARVVALEETARGLLTRRIGESHAGLAALQVGRAATRTYLEQPGLQPFLLDRRG